MYSGGMAEKETGFGVITIGDPAVHSWFRLREKLARQLSGLWWKIFWQCAKVSAAAGHTCRSLPKVERRAPAVEAFSFFCSVLRARQPLARSHYARAGAIHRMRSAAIKSRSFLPPIERVRWVLLHHHSWQRDISDHDG